MGSGTLSKLTTYIFRGASPDASKTAIDQIVEDLGVTSEMLERLKKEYEMHRMGDQLILTVKQRDEDVFNVVHNCHSHFEKYRRLEQAIGGQKNDAFTLNFTVAMQVLNSEYAEAFSNHDKKETTSHNLRPLIIVCASIKDVESFVESAKGCKHPTNALLKEYQKVCSNLEALANVLLSENWEKTQKLHLPETASARQRVRSPDRRKPPAAVQSNSPVVRPGSIPRTGSSGNTDHSNNSDGRRSRNQKNQCVESRHSHRGRMGGVTVGGGQNDRSSSPSIRSTSSSSSYHTAVADQSAK